MDIDDLLGLGKFAESAKEPILKLIEVCQNGMGKLYEPIHVKRMAKARSEEIKLISSASSENMVLPILYSNGNIEIDTTQTQELIARAQSRICYQEAKKQHNIETIVSHAYASLVEDETVSKEPVDEDWTTRFFSIASEVSNENLQIVWGKILSGEIKEPGSYSLRTLDVLRNLSKEEAEMFSRIANYIFSTNINCFIYEDTKILESEDVKFSDILYLDDAGLIIKDDLAFQTTIAEGDDKVILIYGDYVLLIENQYQGETELKLPCYSLTKAGSEIFSVVRKQFKEEYIKKVAEELKKRKVKVSLSKLTSINGEQILFDTDNVTIL